LGDKVDLNTQLGNLGRGWLDKVVVNQRWGYLGNSLSQANNVVVWKWAVADKLGNSTEDLPVLTGSTWERDGSSGKLNSSLSVDVCGRFLSIGSTWKDNIGELGSLVTVVTLVDDEGVLWNVLGADLVSSEEVDELWFCRGNLLR